MVDGKSYLNEKNGNKKGTDTEGAAMPVLEMDGLPIVSYAHQFCEATLC